MLSTGAEGLLAIKLCANADLTHNDDELFLWANRGTSESGFRGSSRQNHFVTILNARLPQCQGKHRKAPPGLPSHGSLKQLEGFVELQLEFVIQPSPEGTA